jgi:type III secretory pathway component EscV
MSQIIKMIIELEKTRKINNLYDRKIKNIFEQQLGDIQSKTSTLNPLNENDEIIRNRVEVKDLTQKYNQYKIKQKYIIEKINALSQKLNIKIDELTDEEKKILEEEIRKYLSLEEYSMSDYLHDKYKEITKNIKKWIELTGTSIRNQIELNDWMKKLKKLKQ